ncbi:MAG: peptide transporter, partial [Cryomorphaceae bacterium]|nr:peptide transporter [Cryomorphaceae bacterium]
MAFWTLAAIFAYSISIDKTPSANRMQLEFSALPLMTKLPLEKVKSSQPSGSGWVLFGDENYPQWVHSNDNKMTFVLGTDRYGRDMLSRLLLGARVSLSVGIISVLIALLIGIPIGSLAGYYGGWIDKVIQTIIQIFWSIPTFLMVIAISFVLGKGFWQVFVAVGLTA